MAIEWRCKGDAKGIEWRCKGDAKGMQRGCKGDAKGMQRGCKGDAKGMECQFWAGNPKVNNHSQKLNQTFKPTKPKPNRNQTKTKTKTKTKQNLADPIAKPQPNHSNEPKQKQAETTA
jgi:hypothetical protein